ncbi:hypothetical protein [Leptospira weilii]|uniref:Uncharacterized protein n=1 Tax=Leptospira weilii str. UI 13098 TaxID=1088542 RepID=M6QDD6_9LEPT|nr:hypothetical protein [Leptospira weilii]EMN91240.1 hypothetical protein LEP1GSC108_3249 [Leptospira weilii str. UI 13098]
MQKVFVYSSTTLEEHPASMEDQLRLDVELQNRGKSEDEQKKIQVGDTFPPIGFKLVGCNLIELSLEEQAEKGIYSVPPGMKVSDNELIPQDDLELMKAGLLSIPQYKLKKIDQINLKFDEAIESVLSKYPKHEPLSWPIIAPQAKYWISYPDEVKELHKPNCIALVAEAKTDQIDDITELANRILQRASAYELYNGTCKRIKRELIAQVEINAKTNPTILYNELEAIEIVFPTFGDQDNG